MRIVRRNQAKDLVLPNPALFRLAVLLCVCILGTAFPAAARNVEVGAYVTSLSDVSARDGSFRVGFYVWFNDPEGRFNLQRYLYFVARSVSISEVETEETPDGGSYTYARIEAVVPHEFELTDFPFDRQQLTLRIEAEDAEDLRFVPDVDSTGASEYLRLLGWTIDKVEIETTDHVYDTDFGYWRDADRGYSQIVLSLDVTRTRSPVAVDDFLGFAFAFLITSLTFFVPCTELGLRVGMTTGSLFAAVVNLNRLHDAAGFRPEFALVDRLAFLIFGALVGSLVIAILTNRIAKHGDEARANRLDTRLGIAMMVTVLGLILLSVQVAMS